MRRFALFQKWIPSQFLNVHDFGMKMYTSQPITALHARNDKLWLACTFSSQNRSRSGTLTVKGTSNPEYPILGQYAWQYFGMKDWLFEFLNADSISPPSLYELSMSFKPISLWRLNSWSYLPEIWKAIKVRKFDVDIECACNLDVTYYISTGLNVV